MTAATAFSFDFGLLKQRFFKTPSYDCHLESFKMEAGLIMVHYKHSAKQKACRSKLGHYFGGPNRNRTCTGDAH